MNPSLILSLGLPAILCWSLLDDFEKARIRRGLAEQNSPTAPTNPPAVERVWEAPPVPASIPDSTPASQPPAVSLEHRKHRLIEVLDAHGMRPFWELRNATPIRFCGWQRSGKSTKAQTLALLRQLDSLGHPVAVATPHKPTPGDRPWPSSFLVQGEGNQWGEIKGAIDGLLSRLDRGETAPHSLILDEFSGYVGQGGMDAEYVQGLMMSLVRESAKHSAMVVLIAHGDTAAMNGGIKGLSAAVWGNFVTVTCSRILVDGKAQPGPEVQISGGGFPETCLNWPRWFTPEWLLTQFPELATIAPQTPVNSTPSLGQTPTLSTPSNEPQAPGLEAHLQAVLDYLKKQGKPCTIRQIQQAKIKALVDSNCNTSERIQLILDSLTYSGHVTPTAPGTYSALGVGSELE